MVSKHTRMLAYYGLTIALVALTTAYVKVPLVVGYAHLGDGAVYLSALLLGPYGAIPAALGSALADLLAGYPLYMAPTALIKGAMGFLAGRFIDRDRRMCPRNVLLLCGCSLMMVAGYFLFECVVYNPATALAAVPGNLLQALVGALLGCALVGAAKLLPRI